MTSDPSRRAPLLHLHQGGAQKRDHEFDLIRSAMLLLAAGGARRVTLLAMFLDDEALREAVLLVRGGGMVMRAERDEVGWDVTIEGKG